MDAGEDLRKFIESPPARLVVEHDAELDLHYGTKEERDKANPRRYICNINSPCCWRYPLRVSWKHKPMRIYRYEGVDLGQIVEWGYWFVSNMGDWRFHLTVEAVNKRVYDGYGFLADMTRSGWGGFAHIRWIGPHREALRRTRKAREFAARVKAGLREAA